MQTPRRRSRRRALCLLAAGWQEGSRPDHVSGRSEQTCFLAETRIDPLESNLHSFIVKIWLEQRADEMGQACWRGHVTHIPGGERRALASIEDLTAFIWSYLDSPADRPEARWTPRRWWNQWKQLLKKKK